MASRESTESDRFSVTTLFVERIGKRDGSTAVTVRSDSMFGGILFYYVFLTHTAVKGDGVKIMFL